MSRIAPMLIPVALALGVTACQKSAPPADDSTTAAVPEPVGPGTAAPPGDLFNVASVTAWSDKWRAVVDKNYMTLSGPGRPNEQVPVTTVKTADGATFDGGAKGSLRIIKKPCTDSQGNQQELTAVLLSGGKNLPGCATAGAIAEANT